VNTRTRPQLPPPVPPETERLLSPQRAFVVQFRDEMDATSPRFSGRVEHLVSGRATRFHSPEELQAFFITILSTVHD
jgi:hypothetical protein